MKTVSPKESWFFIIPLLSCCARNSQGRVFLSCHNGGGMGRAMYEFLFRICLVFASLLRAGCCCHSRESQKEVKGRKVNAKHLYFMALRAMRKRERSPSIPFLFLIICSFSLPPQFISTFLFLLQKTTPASYPARTYSPLALAHGPTN